MVGAPRSRLRAKNRCISSSAARERPIGSQSSGSSPASTSASAAPSRAATASASRGLRIEARLLVDARNAGWDIDSSTDCEHISLRSSARAGRSSIRVCPDRRSPTCGMPAGAPLRSPAEGNGGRRMTLRVVGAGLGRTGTHSLKLALEQLLGGPCYHMSELIDREDDTAVWAAATRGEDVDWASFLSGFAATVDWPACAFWEPIAAAHPDASSCSRCGSRRRPGGRASSGRSCRRFSAPCRRRRGLEGAPADGDRHGRVDVHTRLARPRRAIAGYDRHNEHVRDDGAGGTGWWNTGPGTAGSRSAKRSASRYRQSPSHIRIRRPTSARRAVSN